MIQLLVFMVAGVRYAIALQDVREIVRAVSITPLPSAPEVVAGVVDYRSMPVPVFNMRVRFGAPSPELEPDERFVIARTARRTVALRVDAVDWIRDVPVDEVQEMTELTTGSPYVRSITRHSDEILFIHDLETFLSAAERHELEESLTEWSGERGK